MRRIIETATLCGGALFATAYKLEYQRKEGQDWQVFDYHCGTLKSLKPRCDEMAQDQAKFAWHDTRVSNVTFIDTHACIDLTPEGEQFVIPGCEHTGPTTKGQQGTLW